MVNSTYFKFKQFEIRQDHSAMKVGTDGVLLGAWVQLNQPKNILDIGTGTGLIAMMLAQRCPSAYLVGVENDENACLDATYNFRHSPFADRISLVKVRVQDFAPGDSFDLVISNPPFFENDMLGHDIARNNARHSNELGFKDLLNSVLRVLSKTGEFAVILPKDRDDNFMIDARTHGLYVHRYTSVLGSNDSPIKRVLLQLSFTPRRIHYDKIIIEQARHVYTSAYIELTKEFYLKM